MRDRLTRAFVVVGLISVVLESRLFNHVDVQDSRMNHNDIAIDWEFPSTIQNYAPRSCSFCFGNRVVSCNVLPCYKRPTRANPIRSRH